MRYIKINAMYSVKYGRYYLRNWKHNFTVLFPKKYFDDRNLAETPPSFIRNFSSILPCSVAIAKNKKLVTYVSMRDNLEWEDKFPFEFAEVLTLKSWRYKNFFVLWTNIFLSKFF